MKKNVKKPVSDKSPKTGYEQVFHPEASTAYFADYFSTETTKDAIILGFGQGLPLKQKGKKLMELRKRIVLSLNGVKIFKKLLDETLEKIEKKQK